MFRLIFILCVTAAWAMSCNSGDDLPQGTNPPEEEPTESSYEINVYGETDNGEEFRFTLKGDSFDANWSHDQLTVWLGTDEVNQPLGTFTAVIQPLENIPYAVKTATLSKTDVKVGTADQLNARLYGSSNEVGTFNVAYVTDQIIVVESMSIPMERVITNQTQVAEDVLVTGKFTIVNK